nr:uncharacterized protein LOC117223084 [Megalopta genalis]XP_033331105.1 uncharacterized protein LOC117223084 [Megalopta genalis]
MSSRNCCVPNCKSNYLVPNHHFPKNVRINEMWKEAVCSPVINALTVQERTKYKVCHLHFPEKAYMCSGQRRRLKLDSVPSKNIPNASLIEASCEPLANTSNIKLNVSCIKQDGTEIETCEPLASMSHTQSNIKSNVSYIKKDDKEIKASYEPLANTSNIKSNVSCIKEDDTEIEASSEPIPDTCSTQSKGINIKKRKRNVLSPVTRQRNLSPIIKKFYQNSKSLTSKWKNTTFTSQVNIARKKIFSLYG